MGAAIVDDVDVTDRADAFEEIFEIALGSIVGKIPNVEASGLEFGGVGSLTCVFPFASVSGVPGVALRWPRLALLALALRSWAALVLNGFGFPETEEIEDFIPKGNRLRGRTAAARLAVFAVPILVPVSLLTRGAFPAIPFMISILIIVPISISVPIAVSVAVLTAFSVVGGCWFV